MWRRWRGLGVLVGALVASLVLAPATSIGLQRVKPECGNVKTGGIYTLSIGGPGLQIVSDKVSCRAC